MGNESNFCAITMYSILKRLEADGRITFNWGDETQGGRRGCYRITARGKKAYFENKNNWEYAKWILDQFL